MKNVNSFFRMFSLFLFCTVTLFSFIISDSAYSQQGNWTGNVNFLWGAKSLNKDDWEPAEKQSEFAIEIDIKKSNWPVSLAIDIAGGADEGNMVKSGSNKLTMESQTSEINLGIRKIWDRSLRVRPFIGGGVSFISTEAKMTFLGVSVSDDDTGTGYWLGCGTYWTFKEHFNLGWEFKYSSAEATIYETETNGGGTHLGVLLGFHW